MRMVRHQWPGSDIDLGLRPMVCEQITVERIIYIAEKGLHVVVAALRHGVRVPRKYCACQASHGALYAGGWRAAISALSL